MFQSLKRDVAYFHLLVVLFILVRCVVSIAQARCGLLPLPEGATTSEYKKLFQSLKRDVAYFHVGGLIYFPPGTYMFQSLKRDVAYFHYKLIHSIVLAHPLGFNRSS